MILVSACLAGENCRYDGNNCLREDILNLLKEGKAISVCPEIAGGLLTPRTSMELKVDKKGNTKVTTKDEIDVTEKVIYGSKKCLDIALEKGIKCAILKSKSPSCGLGKIYDGTFSSRLKEGNGIFADMLIKNGIKVYTEENYKEALDFYKS